jgi:hypothetical protein
MSRNAFIVRALENEIAHDSEWSPGFFERLERVHPSDAAAINEMLHAIHAHRTQKLPRPL